MPSDAKRDGWVHGWFTKPGRFWCATVGLREGVQLARVHQGANGLFARSGGCFLAKREVRCWLDEEVVPPEPPVEIDDEKEGC